ncbi:Ribonucleoside-diphosphate reductase large subunit [Dictyocoela roeselum]|nr:Ribonucleoside-diphosphate reductase large subunit [Dictyocoela roeselum]
MIIITRSGKPENFESQILKDYLLKRKINLDITDEEVLELAIKISDGICDNITTRQLEQLIAEACASLATKHPDYTILATRVAVDAIHKDTLDNFYEKVMILANKNKLSSEVKEFVSLHRERIESEIDYSRDCDLNFFGIRTLLKAYLMKDGDNLVERPQDLFMRVSIGMHMDNIDDAIETYHLMSKRYFIHASPTLFNSGTPHPQMSSCFLVCMRDDSIDGIFDTLKDCANISKYSGGLGLSIHNIRARGSDVRGMKGVSNGIIPVIKVFNSMIRFVSQGYRQGAIVVFLEPWHADIFDFLDLRKNIGQDELRARDVFLGLWVPNIFMERVKSNGNWSLFSPDEAKGLSDVYGEEFKKLYCKYEEMGLARKTIPAQKLWREIIETQVETGNPYMVYKDACNEKSNQKNLGTIKSSNLCSEIIEYSAPDETAVCNLASIALPMFIEDGKFNYDKLKEIAKVLTRNLNKVIDINYYPTEATKKSNFRHRPIGIGVSGLADVFAILGLPFYSDEAKEINKKIAETIYYGAMEQSCELSMKYGPYETFGGSPISKGIFQFDMWNVKPTMWPWEQLRAKIIKYGVRNSLVTCLMPTATTSQILGFNECFEPYTTNLYTRRTFAGDFQIVSQYLIRDLKKLNLWNYEIKNLLVEHEGSIQKIPGIPDNLKEIYKTAYEIKMKHIIDMAADRSPFIDQSQSLNIFIPQPTYSQLTSMHFYGYSKGLKTGMYYLRTKPVASAIKFTVDKEMVKKSMRIESNSSNGSSSCSLDEDGNCLNCSA